MKMTNEEYGKYVKKHSPRSSVTKNLCRAFLTGGLLCCLGQLINGGFTALGLSTEDAGTACSMTLIFLGALLTGMGVYDEFAKFAGAGALVPITGFANSVAAPALEFKTEGFVLGTAAKMFTIAGPVIVYGVSASVIYGLILVLFGIV